MPTARPAPHPPATPDHDQDLVAWATANAALLRAGRLSEIDALNLAEELEDMGRGERRALGSHLRNLLLHLLKWRYQPRRRGASWRRSVVNARQEIETLLLDSPSLRAGLPALLAGEYDRAAALAVAETGLSRGRFPERCPFALADVLATDWWPDAG